MNYTDQMSWNRLEIFIHILPEEVTFWVQAGCFCGRLVMLIYCSCGAKATKKLACRKLGNIHFFLRQDTDSFFGGEQQSEERPCCWTVKCHVVPSYSSGGSSLIRWTLKTSGKTILVDDWCYRAQMCLSSWVDQCTISRADGGLHPKALQTSSHLTIT